MEAIAAYAVFAVQVLGQGVAVGVFGQGLVEGGIEHRHLGQAGKQFDRRFDAQQVSRVVQWGQRCGGTNRIEAGVIQAAGAPADAEGKPFFTNRSGRFVADGLAPGRYRLVIQGAVVGEFVIPEKVEGTVDVGEIRTSPPPP